MGEVGGEDGSDRRRDREAGKRADLKEVSPSRVMSAPTVVRCTLDHFSVANLV